MALIHNINKTLDVIRAINENNDQSAASILGLQIKKPTSGSFLERICNVASAVSESHNGGLLVTPDEKNISSKSIVSEIFGLSSDLCESVAMISTNTAASISSLSESNVLNTNPILPNMAIEGIKDTFVDGLTVSKDALSENFYSTVNLVKTTRNLVSALLENCYKKNYINLVTNAVIGANALCALDKISEYKYQFNDIITEAMSTYDIENRADTVLFDTLDLQEGLFDLYFGMFKFNNAMIKSFNENTSSIKDFISIPLEKVVRPLTESNSLSGNRMNSLFERSLTSIAALYDEYLQDACGLR